MSFNWSVRLLNFLNYFTSTTSLIDKINALQLTAQVGCGSVFVICCRFATYPCTSNCCKLGKHTMTEMLKSRYCCRTCWLIFSAYFRFWKMECSTQGNSFVVAWGQEWIPNQRVGGYLVSIRYINHMTPALRFLVCRIDIFPPFPFLVPFLQIMLSMPISLVWQFMFSIMLALSWSHFTIVPTTFFLWLSFFCSYVIHAYFYVLTADVLYDLGTALEFVSPLCPQLFLEVAGLGNFAKVPILTCFAYCRSHNIDMRSSTWYSHVQFSLRFMN